MEKSNTSLSSSFHGKVEPNNEHLFWPSSANEMVIQESRISNPMQACNVSNITQSNNDSIVNTSMYDSFAIDESKYDSFEDSLDENAQAHVSPKKINASDFLTEQVNVTLRKVRDRQKLKGGYLCDSLEDICSMVSNIDNFSSSDEIENINNILEKHGICEDSLRNDICCNRNASLNDQNFDDDSLAILEAEKHFEDSLEDGEVASCLDSLMILGSSIADMDVTVDKIGMDHCGMKTSVEIIYENAPLSSDESYRTAENFISEKNSPSLSDRPMSHDSLDEIHDISEMVSEMSSNALLKTDASSSKVADNENTSLPNSFLDSLSSKVVRSELHSVTDNRFSSAESERPSSVVNSCYFYDTFCMDESIDIPLESTNTKCGFDHKSSMELIGADRLSENINVKAASKGSEIENSDSLKNVSKDEEQEDYTALHAECKENLTNNSLRKLNSEIKNTSPSLDSVDDKTSISRQNLKAVKESKKTSCLPAEIKNITDNPNNSKVANEEVKDDNLENTLGAAEILSLDSPSFDSQSEVKEVSLHLSDHQLSKHISTKSSLKKGSAVSIVKKDKFNLNLQIELTTNETQDVNVVPITSADQVSRSEIMLPGKSCILPGNGNKDESKIEVFNLKAHQFKNACAANKTDVLDEIVSEAHKKMPTLPLAIKRTISKESINNYLCEYRVSPSEMPKENFGMKLNVNLQLLKALDLHDSFYDFMERCKVQSRDSIMPLNLCIRDEQHEINHEFFEGKENMRGLKSPESGQGSHKSVHKKESVMNSGNKTLSGYREKRAGKTPLVTKIPVRKAESPFVIPVYQKQNKQDIRTSPSCGKAKKIPLVKSTSIDSMGKTTPMETPKKHHFCTVRNSICRVPKSKEKPKKFKNIQSPVAMYVGNLRSPLKPTLRFNGNQISTPSKVAKSPSDVNALLPPTVKK